MSSDPEPQELARLLLRLDGLRTAERRAASARMVSVIAHLIGTPLNVIAGRAGLLRASSTPESIDENVRRIEEQVERLAQRIRRLVDYFALAEPTAGPVPLGQLLLESRELYGPIAEQRGVRLELNALDLEELRVDGGLLPVVLTTLLSLALRSAPRGARIGLSVSGGGPKKLSFELDLPGLAVPPGRLNRLDPPEEGVRYDVDALETLWICMGLMRRIGGGFEVVAAASGPGSLLHLECPHT